MGFGRMPSYGGVTMSFQTSPPKPSFSVQGCAKFFNSLYLHGVAPSEQPLESVSSGDTRLVAATVSNQFHPDSPSRVSFSAHLLLADERFATDLSLEIRFAGVAPVRITLGELASAAGRPAGRLQARFDAMIQEPEYARMLDVGGRARSGVLHADRYRNKEVVVLDILEGEGVDQVCDAHCMSRVLGAGAFDVVYSAAVFEHLAMPWKVAVEMNRVMRTGAVGLIVSHQTVGLHDRPWDYFRFSDAAWKSLFNRHTGFEILDVELGDFQYIVPGIYRDRYRDAEKAGGFDYSAVLIRKISETGLDWPLAAGDVTEDMYPE